MSLDATAIQKIVDLSKQADVETLEIEGVTYTPIPMFDLRKAHPEPKGYLFHTLTGLAEYLMENKDGIPPEDAIVHVVDPIRVEVWGKLHGFFQQRFYYAGAHAMLPDVPLGIYMAQEEFVTAVQAGFEPRLDRSEVLMLAGNLMDEEVRTEVDDGVSQKVSSKSGVSVVEMARVPNPVSLAPYRTFMEVDQPSGPFIFRVTRKMGGEGVALALFEADGGAWKLDAVEKVRDYLKGELTGWTVIA